ncbi:MAG TPA: hypothetical protein VNM39_13230 [Verrucomicrobiae bacterium]|nr:hypothetical protein [Verrucomicrobiae bacterium]
MQNERKQLQRELAEHLRDKDRAKLGLLRAQIKAARVDRGSMLTRARVSCRTARVALKERQALERAELVTAHRAERVAGKTACETGKQTAKLEGLELERTAKRTLKEERIYQRRIREAGKAPKVRATKRELQAEDDDAVRSNLPAELVPVFEVVKKKIKGSARRSRTEAFLEWAEENPEEILAVQEVAAEKYLRDLMRQQREHGRSMRKAGRYSQSPEELAELLAAVPF